uniref:CPG4 domain-containing protein n=1 Tax=Rhabditophanes sp. KR3021 TaxID=114890 RepID=A0AC35U2L3_9BILA
MYAGPDECLHFCQDHIFNVLKPAVSITMPIKDKYKNICSGYQNAKTCMLEKPQCPSHSIFKTVSSGIVFMCEEQKDAFAHNIDCINDWFQYSNFECESFCLASNLINGLSIKTMLEKDFKFLQMFDPYIMKMSVNEGCRVTECMLKCYKQKLNTRCEGIGGSLLVEALVRPMGDVQGLGSPIIPALTAFLPQQCGFITTAADTGAELRLDDGLNNEIIKKYNLLKGEAEVGSGNEVVHDPFAQDLSLDADSPLGPISDKRPILDNLTDSNETMIGGNNGSTIAPLLSDSEGSGLEADWSINSFQRIGGDGEVVFQKKPIAKPPNKTNEKVYDRRIRGNVETIVHFKLKKQKKNANLRCYVEDL